MTNAPAPVQFSEVADVLDAATAPASPAELAGEAAAVASFRTAGVVVQGSSWTRHLRRRAAVAAVGAFGLASMSGVAAAATGSLPDAAQDAARSALTKVGVDVPRGKGLATAPGQLKKAEKAEKDAATKDAKVKADKAEKVAKDKAAKPEAPPAAKQGQGGTISSIAKDPTLTGAEKGAAVSGAASDGKSQAGEEHGPPSSVPAGPPTSSPSDTAPGKTTSATAGPRALP